jgi:hypothetical protein
LFYLSYELLWWWPNILIADFGLMSCEVSWWGGGFNANHPFQVRPKSIYLQPPPPLMTLKTTIRAPPSAHNPPSTEIYTPSTTSTMNDTEVNDASSTGNQQKFHRKCIPLGVGPSKVQK